MGQLIVDEDVFDLTLAAKRAIEVRVEYGAPR
jgi:hypothetical protein